jgi:hypothetical protein
MQNGPAFNQKNKWSIFAEKQKSQFENSNWDFLIA